MTELSQECARLLSLVAHEIRTPAGAIAGCLRTLQQGRTAALTTAQRTLVDAAERSCTRLFELLDRLDELAKLEGGLALTRRRTTLAEFLSALCQPTGASIEPGFVIQGEVPHVTLAVDVTRLREAICMLTAATRPSSTGETPIAVRAWQGIGHDELDIMIALGTTAAIAEVGPHARTTRLPFDAWRGGHGVDLVLAARVVGLHEGDVCTLATRPGSAVTLVRLPSASGQAA